MAVLIEIFIGVCGTLLGISYYQNTQRSRYHWRGELKANCLLTRYPLLLIPGQRSLFYYRNYYNFLGSYLAEHGYDVFHLHLPWRKNRKTTLLRFLENLRHQKRQVHVVGHISPLKEFQEVLSSYPDVILSQSEYQTDDYQNGSLPWALKILNVFHNYFIDSPLDLRELGPYENGSDHCYKNLLHRLQVLAENDYIKGNQNEGCHK